MACPVCGSTYTQCVATSEHYDTYRCTKCGNIYTEEK